MRCSRGAIVVLAGVLGAGLICLGILVRPLQAERSSPASADLTSITRTSGAAVEVRWSGVTSLAYVVQATTGLVGAVWVPLGTNTYHGAGFAFTDADAANLEGRFYRVSWMVDTNDTSAPAWPGGNPVSASDETPGSLRLAWTACRDDREIACYGVYMGDELIAAVPGGTTSLVVNGLGPGREYAFTIEACDVGGNTTTTGPDIVTHTLLQPEPFRNASLGIDSSDNPGSLLLHSGEYVKRRTDMRIRGRRMGFALRRTYRSNLGRRGPLGYGWDANVFAHVEEAATGDVLWHPGDGRAFRYRKLPDGSHETPPGLYNRLMTNETGYVLRTRSGTQYRFDAQGRMTNRQDRVGNSLAYRYTGSRLSSVIDEFGREITFAYDGSDRLATITDFTGRQVVYTYDAHDNLLSVRSPVVTGTPHGNDFPAGKTERYAYDTFNPDPRLAHNMVQVIGPNEVADGSLVARELMYYGQAGNDYDRVLFREVGGVNASGVNAGGTLAYTYELGRTGGPEGTVSKTTATDRNNTVCVYYHDTAGRCLVALDDHWGMNVAHEMTYSFHGERVEYVLPEGNRILYEYDDANADRFQQGNLLSVSRSPDATRGGDPTQLKTSFTYEPLNNRILTVTDARGNDAGYVPQNGGAWSSERYTATYTYDYQEADTPPPEAAHWGITIPPGLLNKGDVNDDGRTDRAMGMRVREDAPSVNLLAGSNQANVEGDTSQEIVTRYVHDDFGQLLRVEGPMGNADVSRYYPENDPDGDGTDLITGRDATTGGYRRDRVADALAGPRRRDPYAPVAITNAYAYDPRGNIVTLTDGRGKRWQRTYNQLNQLVQTEAPKVDPAQGNGYLVRTVYDANDNVVTTAVENVTTGTNHLPRAGSPAFFYHSRTYDILDNPVEQTQDATRDPAIPASAQPQQLTTRYEYDANENLVRVRSPLAVAGTDANNVVRYEYDALDRAVAMTQGEGSANASEWLYSYDANGNRTSWIDAEDNDTVPGPESAAYTYDGYDRLGAVTDRAGNVSTYSYDPLGRRIGRDWRGPVDGSGGEHVVLAAGQWSYDELGRLFQQDTELFLPDGVTAGCTNAGLAEGALTPADDKITQRFEYDAGSRQTFAVDDDLALYAWEYDGANRRRMYKLPLIDRVTPGGPYQTRTAFEYDSNHNLVGRTEHHTSPEGHVAPGVHPIIRVYDNVNRCVRVTDPMGHTQYYEYDSRDNLISRYDARGPWTPDPLGLYTNHNINAHGNPVRYAYDGVGRCWRQDAELRVDGRGDGELDTGNPLNPDGMITTLTEFNANRLIVGRTDDNANSSTYAYDALNRLVRQTNADGGYRTLTYNGDHQQTGLIDENNTEHTFAYDGLGRQVSHTLVYDPARKIAGDTLPLLVGTTLRTYEYDGLSRLTRCTDNNDPGDGDDDWAVDRRYDSLGRLVKESQNGQVLSAGYTSDDRTELCYPAGNRTVHYTYDPHDRAIRVANDDTVNVSNGIYGCTGKSVMRVSGTTGDVVVATRDYNDSMYLDGCQYATASGTDLASVNVGRDQGNRVSNSSVEGYPPASFYAVRGLLEYNSVGRMTGEDTFLESMTAPGRRQTDLMYDGAALRAAVEDYRSYGPRPRGREARLALAVTTNSRNYNAVYERTDAPYAYNASPGTGVRTADARFVYQYDGLDRLRVVRAVTNPAVVVAVYRYDAAPDIVGGRRVEKDVVGGDVTRFYYDGDHVVEERVVSNSVERLARQYLHGQKPDEWLAINTDTNADGVLDAMYFPLTDWNNSAIQLVDESGTQVEFYEYSLFGAPKVLDPSTMNELGPGGPAGNPYLFAGRRYDAETGQYYYRARYYDPEDGEFLTRDPIGFWGDPASFGNPMAYVGFDYANQRDPSGLGVDFFPCTEASITLAFGDPSSRELETVDLTGPLGVASGTAPASPGSAGLGGPTSFQKWMSVLDPNAGGLVIGPTPGQFTAGQTITVSTQGGVIQLPPLCPRPSPDYTQAAYNQIRNLPMPAFGDPNAGQVLQDVTSQLDVYRSCAYVLNVPYSVFARTDFQEPVAVHAWTIYRQLSNHILTLDPRSDAAVAGMVIRARMFRKFGKFFGPWRDADPDEQRNGRLMNERDYSSISCGHPQVEGTHPEAICAAVRG